MARELKLMAALMLLITAAGTGTARAEVLESREAEPVVLTGSETPKLLGVAPGDVVAFAWFEGWNRVPDGWVPTPVQVDERKLIDYRDFRRSTSGGTGGFTALGYADPATDGHGLDANDEISMMAFDAGLPAGDRQPPPGVDPDTRTSVTITDPLDPGQHAYVYLFARTGDLPQDAGYDLVDYRPDSGLTTARYDLGIRNRWQINRLTIAAAEGPDVDILDGDKFNTTGSGCEESELAFSRDGGGYAARIDGPVRAIRSVVGAGDDQFARRDYTFYEGMFETRTILDDVSGPRRVISALDFSARAIGATYRNSANQAGVKVDGNPDVLDRGPAGWEQVSGPQGSLTSVSRLVSAPPGAGLSTFQEDEALPPAGSPMLCSGDAHAYGAAGPEVDLPGTGSAGADRFEMVRKTWLDGPEAGPDLGQLRSRQVNNPLRSEVGRTEPAILVARAIPARISIRPGESRTIRVVVRNHGQRKAKSVRFCSRQKSRTRCRATRAIASGRALTRKMTIRAGRNAKLGPEILWVKAKARKSFTYPGRISIRVKPR